MRFSLHGSPDITKHWPTQHLLSSSLRGMVKDAVPILEIHTIAAHLEISSTYFLNTATSPDQRYLAYIVVDLGTWTPWGTAYLPVLHLQYLRSTFNNTLKSITLQQAMAPPASWTFLDLPAEIRNRIYYYVAPDEIHIKAGGSRARHRHDLALLYTCRIIMSEFADILDDQCIIHVHLHNLEEEAAYRNFVYLHEWSPLLEKRPHAKQRDEKTVLHVQLGKVADSIRDWVDLETMEPGPLPPLHCVITL